MRLTLIMIMSLSVFGLGCAAIYLMHSALSQTPVLGYAVVGITGASAIVWPIALVLVIARTLRRS